MKTKTMLQKKISLFCHNLIVLGCLILSDHVSAQGAGSDVKVADNAAAIGPTYKVDLSQAVTRYVTITMTADASGEETMVMLPTWTPGSYLIREYAKHIDRISATDSKGNQLELLKISKNRWKINTGEEKKFTLTYRLFCDEVSVRTNSVDFNRAVLVGAGTFLTIPEQVHREHRVKLTLPKNWQASSCSLKKGRTSHAYIAKDYDELVDSPIVAGNVVEYPFEIDGVPHYLVNVGQRTDWDHKTAIEDITKLVLEHQRMWGEVPYDRYYFITVFGGSGGLEHDSSCLMMTPWFDVRDEGSYRGWLNLASHEFFHTWNIRRLRPKELVNYDYESEVYTSALWIAEGLTSYYEDLMLVRAGIISRDEFITALSGGITSLQRTEGRLVQSLRDSSHDAWIKFYRPASNSRTTQVSYYNKGAIVGLLLDTKIRSVTEGKKSLDDVLRVLWKRHKGAIGYTEADFRNLCSEVAGVDLEPWFQVAVDSSEELDYQELADCFGFEVGDIKPEGSIKPESSTNSLSKSSKPAEAAAEPAGKSKRRWIGIGEFNSPATKAGVSDTDEVIAVNSIRVDEGVESVAQQYEIGDPIKLVVAREGKIQEILLVVGARPAIPNWNLKIASRPTKQQKANLKSWIAPTPVVEESDEVENKAGNEENKDANEENTEATDAKKDDDRVVDKDDKQDKDEKTEDDDKSSENADNKTDEDDGEK